MTAVADPGLAELRSRLERVERRVRDAVTLRRAVDPNPDDPFRGLYIAEADVDRLLDAGPPELPPPAANDDTLAGSRIARLAHAFELDDLDIDLLFVALAPDLDARFERLYGYLHDDVTRRRASIGLALELAGASAVAAGPRARLGPGGALVDGELVLVDDAERPFLTRALRVPDRVTLHLLGHDAPDPVLARLIAPRRAHQSGDVEALARAIEHGVRLVYIRERAPTAGCALASAAFAAGGRDAVRVDLAFLGAGDDVPAVARAGVREARLRDAGFVAGPIEAALELDGAAVRAFAELAWPTVLTGSRSWDPSWSREPPLVIELPVPTPAERAATWRSCIGDDEPVRLDPLRATSQFLLGPEQVARAAAAARLTATFEMRPIAAEDLRAGARAQNAAGLERLARRIAPRATWSDLVLPEEAVAHLQELAGRAASRDRVLDEWRMGGAGAGGRGIAALFAGESGTGKTLAAEVLAYDLGLDLYAIDLATVVDKYVGETEKNLDRIFAEAEHVHGVLFFDEADALFGKRSEVRDAHDRYANVEVAYLLQRMESFDGTAILATNLRANIDEAFARRLDAVVDFPMPDEEHRLRLWELSLGTIAPREPTVDLEFCARAFDLSGGNIRNIAVSAAYLAAAGARAISMDDLIHATRREYRKLGRLLDASEFGPYHEPAAV